MSEENAYPIRVVSRRTGLSPHVLRIWERRYEAVSPIRTPTNRRLYTESDIARLNLLRLATNCGHGIGQVAHLSTDRLKELVAEDDHAVEKLQSDIDSRPESTEAKEYLSGCLIAVRQLDFGQLEDTLDRAAIDLSTRLLLNEVVIPLIQRIGDLWYEGTLRVANEHMASAVLRTFLGRMIKSASSSAPRIIVTTLVGQIHEFGALVAAAIASVDGWQAIYLGPNLPAEEIALSARESDVRLVAVSLVYPPDDPQVADELRRLRRALDDDVSVLVGGRAAAAYGSVLQEIGAIKISDVDHFRAEIEKRRVLPASV